MKLRLLVVVLLLSKLGYSQSEQKLEEYQQTYIKNVITLFKQGNIDSIAQVVRFPLKREYPIPNVQNEKELSERFAEIFDKTLVDIIANSKLDQWFEVGWRGIMLDNGTVWLDSYDGKIIAVNYQSDFEKRLIVEIINNDKSQLHKSLQTFQSPVYRIMTKNYLVRIDKISDYSYRYASWKIGENESSKPDIIIYNGELNYEGSGGNHIIVFSNGNYTYKVFRNIIGKSDAPDITLEVKKNGIVILKEEGNLMTD